MEVSVVHVLWEGPMSIEEATHKAISINDYGLYQLYGTHPVSGPDTLLYIGQAEARPFGQRLGEHQEEWEAWEPVSLKAFLGAVRRMGARDE